ncbi:hypothetical protein [Legionella hackeliae]|uniref:Uncharacterized protein n=1 Tax=Legionella hackeliae TaxID=449 RepID=A0A0A8URV7_LEGHA|nr:hypothetical protein [Legionella hackeliae]KTD13114.1 hypothetical protein Lhac_0983 [Legionella hackeliae]CEK11575.1 conserved exported protein of unknown function [coiled-coil domain] [Legionella hackeliae]STX48348.1 Uncharacterised protein [Legionella hackeliae]
MAFARNILWLVIFLLSGWGVQNVQAEETDQFTLPPGELVDIGPLMSHRIFDILEKAMNQTNLEIQQLEAKAKDSRRVASQLALRRTDAYIIELIYKEVGIGLPESTLERWVHWGRFPKELQPMRYTAIWPWKTVYWLVISQFPGTLFLLSPTINMYGHYFGTDKIGHFFQQGRGYYKVYMRHLARGKSPEQAHTAMVIRGQRQEDGLYGTMINGIYSNGDLSANYAGWKFYMNLAHPVKIGNQLLPPIIVLNGNKWEFAQKIDKDTLLKPYINDNLNEAWNPCHYFFMRSQIRRNIKKRCTEWIQRTGLTRTKVQKKLIETSLWMGEDYGHWLPIKDAVTLDVCFSG